MSFNRFDCHKAPVYSYIYSYCLPLILFGSWQYFRKKYIYLVYIFTGCCLQFQTMPAGFPCDLQFSMTFTETGTNTPSESRADSLDSESFHSFHSLRTHTQIHTQIHFRLTDAFVLGQSFLCFSHFRIQCKFNDNNNDSICI